MIERVSESIGSYFAKKIANNTDIILCDFYDESIRYRNLITDGIGYNFNYRLDFLSISYNFSSLAPKPFRGYSLTDTEMQKRAADIEFGRQYNESTVDANNKFYASKLSIKISAGGTVQDAVEILLYNNGIKLNRALLSDFGSPIMPKSGRLIASVSNLSQDVDEVIIFGSYTGNVSYSFNTGHQEHSHTHNFP